MYDSSTATRGGLLRTIRAAITGILEPCLKPVTLQCHLAAVQKAHKAAGLPSPIRDNALVGEVLEGIKRTFGTATVQKAPVLTDDLRLMLRHVPAGLLGLRDPRPAAGELRGRLPPQRTGGPRRRRPD